MKDKLKNELPIGTGSACPLSFSIIPPGQHEKNDLKIKIVGGVLHTRKTLAMGYTGLGPHSAPPCTALSS